MTSPRNKIRRGQNIQKYLIFQSFKSCCINGDSLLIAKVHFGYLPDNSLYFVYKTSNYTTISFYLR